MSIETYGLSRGRGLPRWCTRCWENHCQNQLLWVKRAWNHCQNPEIGTTFFSNSSNQPKFTFEDEEKQLRIGIWIHKKKHNYWTSIIFYDLLQISVSPKICTSGWLTRRSSIWGSRNKRSWSSFAWHPNKTTWSGVVEHRFWGFFRVSADTLQGINISHLGKRKIIFKMQFFGGYVSSLEGIFLLHFPSMFFVLSVNGWCFMLGSLFSHKPPTVTRNHWLDKIKILFFSAATAPTCPMSNFLLSNKGIQSAHCRLLNTLHEFVMMNLELLQGLQQKRSNSQSCLQSSFVWDHYLEPSVQPSWNFGSSMCWRKTEITWAHKKYSKFWGY